MSDLISRQDAIEAVATVTMSIHLSNVLCDKLLALPSADRPTGEWKEKIIKGDSVWTQHRYYCSACGGWNTYGKSDYCPNCGSLMKKGD